MEKFNSKVTRKRARYPRFVAYEDYRSKSEVARTFLMERDRMQPPDAGTTDQFALASHTTDDQISVEHVRNHTVLESTHKDQPAIYMLISLDSETEEACGQMLKFACDISSDDKVCPAASRRLVLTAVHRSIRSLTPRLVLLGSSRRSWMSTWIRAARMWCPQCRRR